MTETPSGALIDHSLDGVYDIALGLVGYGFSLSRVLARTMFTVPTAPSSPVRLRDLPAGGAGVLPLARTALTPATAAVEQTSSTWIWAAVAIAVAVIAVLAVALVRRSRRAVEEG